MHHWSAAPHSANLLASTLRTPPDRHYGDQTRGEPLVCGTVFMALLLRGSVAPMCHGCHRANERKVVTHCHPFHAVSRLVYKLVTATQTSGLPLGFCCLDYKLASLLTLTARDTNQYCQYYSICHNGRFHASASLISSAAKPTNELQTYVNKPRWNLFAVY